MELASYQWLAKNMASEESVENPWSKVLNHVPVIGKWVGLTLSHMESYLKGFKVQILELFIEHEENISNLKYHKMT